MNPSRPRLWTVTVARIGRSLRRRASRRHGAVSGWWWMVW